MNHVGFAKKHQFNRTSVLKVLKGSCLEIHYQQHQDDMQKVASCHFDISALNCPITKLETVYQIADHCHCLILSEHL